MKCPECGARLKTHREEHRYDECGLAHVTLVGAEVARCAACDYSEVTIPNIEALHRRIAQVLIDKPTRLRGDEVRFLRKSLGWSATSFARHLSVKLETVSRWENDKQPIGAQADLLLRVLVAQGALTMSYPLERLPHIDLGRATATRVRLARRRSDWKIAAA
jgi:putative zinc finger/helix-turn-helix YgiT family protein